MQGALHTIKIYQSYETHRHSLPEHINAGKCCRIRTEDQSVYEKRINGKGIKGNQKAGELQHPL